MSEFMDRLNAMRLEKQLYTLMTLPEHLADSEEIKRLYALIDHPDFRQAKIQLTFSANPLCRDIELAVVAALNEGDVVKLTHYGFMYSDYSEGRLSRPDIGTLYSQNPQSVKRELNLYPEQTRVRILIGLALREAASGHISEANDLVAQVNSLAGIPLTASCSEFIGGSVVRLLKRGCSSVLDLLRLIPKAEMAARQTARIAIEQNIVDQKELLKLAITTLHHVAKLAVQNETNTKDLLDSFEFITNLVFKISDESSRQELSVLLLEFVDSIKSPKEEGKNYAIVMIVESLVGVLELKLNLQALLGRIFVQNGLLEQGYKLLEQAVDGCEIFEESFQTVTRTLWSVPSVETKQLFKRLIIRSKTDAKRSLEILRNMYLGIADAPKSIHLCEAIEMLTLQDAYPNSWSEPSIITAQVLAYHNAGKILSISPTPRWLVAWVFGNPMLAPDYKLRFIESLINISIFSREGVPFLSDKWLNNISRWLMQYEEQLDHNYQRISYVRNIASSISTHEHGREAEFGWQLARRVEDSTMKGQILELVLTLAENQETTVRLLARKEILFQAGHINDEAARVALLSKWLDSARGEDLASAMELRDYIPKFENLSFQMEILDRLAGVLSRYDLMETADTVWSEAIAISRRIQTQSKSFAAAATLSAMSADEILWREVLQALGSQDVGIMSISVQLVADSCATTSHLVEVEHAVENLALLQDFAPSRLEIELALARAWARFGFSHKGILCLKRALIHLRESGEGRNLRDSQRQQIYQTALLFIQCPQGKLIFQALIEETFSQLVNDRLVLLVQCLVHFADETGAQWAFLELLKRYSERLPLSIWSKIDVLAIIANGLARRNQVKLARDVLSSITLSDMQEIDYGSEDILKDTKDLSTLSILVRLASTYEIIQRKVQSVDFALEASAKIMGIWNVIYSTSYENELPLHLTPTGKGQFMIPESQMLIEIAEILALKIATEHPLQREYSGRWRGQYSIAQIWTDLGNMQRALQIIQGIQNIEYREMQLAELGEYSFELMWPHISQCWNMAMSPQGREMVCRIIARNLFRLNRCISQERECNCSARSIKSVEWSLPPNRIPIMYYIIRPLSIITTLYLLSIVTLSWMQGITYKNVLGYIWIGLLAFSLLIWLLKKDWNALFYPVGMVYALIYELPLFLGRIVRPYVLHVLLHFPESRSQPLCWQSSVENLGELDTLVKASLKESQPFDFLLTIFIRRMPLSHLMNSSLGEHFQIHKPTQMERALSRGYLSKQGFLFSNGWYGKIRRKMIRVVHQVGLITTLKIVSMMSKLNVLRQSSSR